MKAQELADLAVRMWPGLVADHVGQLVRQGGDEVVFSMPARGVQFRADCLADCCRYLGPAERPDEGEKPPRQTRRARRVTLRQTTIFDKVQTTLF